MIVMSSEFLQHLPFEVKRRLFICYSIFISIYLDGMQNIEQNLTLVMQPLAMSLHSNNTSVIKTEFGPVTLVTILAYIHII